MRFLTVIIISLTLCSCSDAFLLEKSENFELKTPAKILCISPRFSFTETQKNFNLAEVKTYNDLIRSDIKKFSTKHGLDLQVLDLDDKADMGFYRDLLNLKRNLLSVNFNQSNPMDYSAFDGLQENKRVFVYPPRLSHEFCRLAQKYGTPYFSYLGIYASGKSVLLYHVLVNTDKAETIYRELKTIHSGLNEVAVRQMVFDSYALLAQEMKK